jgi:hypothetical protein
VRTTVRASKVLVDSAYGKSTDTVYEAVRACGVAAVQCSRGKYYGASSQPMSDLNPKPGRRMGVHWFEDRVDGRQTRCITIDANWWKSFIQSRLSTPIGDHGSLTIYRAEAYQHATLAEHLTAEFRTRTFGRGKTSTDGEVFELIIPAAAKLTVDSDLIIVLSSDETRVRMSNSAPKRKVMVYTLYGEFYQSFTDLYKCAEHFNTAAPNIHRKMNMKFFKKNLMTNLLFNNFGTRCPRNTVLNTVSLCTPILRCI